VKGFGELTGEQQSAVREQLFKEGWSYAIYHTVGMVQGEPGVCKKGIGCLLKDIIVESEWHEQVKK
jgi:hypothetical protein